MLCLLNQKIHHTKSIFHSTSGYFFPSSQPGHAIPFSITAKLGNQSMPSGSAERIVVMAFKDYLFFQS